MSVIYRKFNDDKARYMEEEDVKFSKYFPESMDKAFAKVLKNVNHNKYILCPIYRQGDIQVGVTGHVKTNETVIEGLCREVKEELCIAPIRDIITVEKNRKEGRKTYNIFAVDINNCKTMNKKEQKTSNQASDNRDNKVGCYIYGSRESILKHLNSASLDNFPGSDDIVGISAIKIISIKNYFY
jgi:hypothetical protein